MEHTREKIVTAIDLSKFIIGAVAEYKVNNGRVDLVTVDELLKVLILVSTC